jgi:hypothetical protein
MTAPRMRSSRTGDSEVVGAAEEGGDRADLLWTVPEMGDGGHVEAFATVELADPVLVELLVEIGLDHRLGCLDIVECDRRVVVLAPHAAAILLEEERVALGEFEHAPNRATAHCSARCSSRSSRSACASMPKRPRPALPTCELGAASTRST